MAQIRKVAPGGYRITPISIPKLGDDPALWLVTQAQQHGLQTLLAHADDGVIWGTVDGAKLLTSHDVFGDSLSPPLRTVTLQQARLFGECVELLLWRAESEWRARLVEDTPDGGKHYDEFQTLWGNRCVQARDGFALVCEGRQGLRHAPPVNIPAAEFSEDHRPLRLQVRHYLKVEPETGLLRVTLSRLVRVKTKPRAQAKEG